MSRLKRWLYPLDSTDKWIVGFLGFLVAVQVVLLMIEPSWSVAGGLLTNLVVCGLVWQASFYRGCWHTFRPMTDLGAVVGEQLHTHGELLITKHGGQYRIIPLHDVERNT